MASPIVDIPFHVFLMATLIGIIPASYITVKVCFLFLDLSLDFVFFFLSGAMVLCNVRIVLYIEFIFSSFKFK